MTEQNYEINFKYIPGKKNTAADALSRNIFSQKVKSAVCSMQKLTTLDTELVYSEQRKDDTWKQIIKYLEVKTQSEAQNYRRNINYQISNYTMDCFIAILK